MHRDMEIAVIDGQRQFGNGYCLPAGPLREKPSRLAQCDLVIVNGASLAPYEHTLQISSNEWQSLDNTQHLPHTALQQVQIYTAIGNPQRFVDHLNDKGIMIAHCHFFPDHHHFTQDDFTTLDSTLPIVMTEKDAVKCQQLHLENAWYLPITAPLDNAFKIAFNSHFVTIAARDNSYE
jgi:tetraacyldisaccharide 4'-kinase